MFRHLTISAREDGMCLVGGVDVTYHTGLNVHLAALAHVLQPEAAMSPNGVAYLTGRQLDAAVFYDGKHLRVLAEGLVAKKDHVTSVRPWALHSFVTYKLIPTLHQFAYEAALSTDDVSNAQREPSTTSHRKHGCSQIVPYR